MYYKRTDLVAFASEEGIDLWGAINFVLHGDCLDERCFHLENGHGKQLHSDEEVYDSILYMRGIFVAET